MYVLTNNLRLMDTRNFCLSTSAFSAVASISGHMPDLLPRLLQQSLTDHPRRTARTSSGERWIEPEIPGSRLSMHRAVSRRATSSIMGPAGSMETVQDQSVRDQTDKKHEEAPTSGWVD